MTRDFHHHPLPYTKYGPPALLLALIQKVLEDYPIGFAILTPKGTLLWCNAEAAVACAVWNRQPLGADALPLASHGFRLPEILLRHCQELFRTWSDQGLIPAPVDLAEPALGLYAKLSLHVDTGEVWGLLRLDYRRPREDRQCEIPPVGLRTLALLSFRECEVALRLRDGLTTLEIARMLQRSPYTIKCQLTAVYRKIGAQNRAHAVSLLNQQ